MRSAADRQFLAAVCLPLATLPAEATIWSLLVVVLTTLGLFVLLLFLPRRPRIVFQRAETPIVFQRAQVPCQVADVPDNGLSCLTDVGLDGNCHLPIQADILKFQPVVPPAVEAPPAGLRESGAPAVLFHRSEVRHGG